MVKMEILDYLVQYNIDYQLYIYFDSQLDYRKYSHFSLANAVFSNVRLLCRYISKKPLMNRFFDPLDVSFKLLKNNEDDYIKSKYFNPVAMLLQ